MTGGPYVAINWERVDGALSAYLTISRRDQPVERIQLTTGDVAQILADGAYLWAVVEPMRQGSMQNLHNAAEPDHFVDATKMVAGDERLADITAHSSPLIKGTAPDRSAGAGKVIDSPPHFIGVWGE